MSQARITLDNLVLSGTLRYKRRSVSYKSRPLQPRTIQDVFVVRQIAPKPRTMAKTIQDVRPLQPASAADKQHVKAKTPQPRSVFEHTQPASKTRHKRVSKHHYRKVGLKGFSLYAAAFVIFGFGLYVGISGLTANKKVAAQVKELQTTAVAADGKPDVTAPPSTEKLTASAVHNYAVSPTNPRYIDIPKLKVHARVLAMTVDKNNELKSPYGIYDAGWYSSSSLPGQNGAMLVDGHSGIGKTHGIFHDLSTLVVGDAITVTRGDGQTFTYKVVKAEIQDVAKVDMSSLLVSQDTAKPGLNLITCAGDWIPGTFSLKQRALVYAVMQ